MRKMVHGTKNTAKPSVINCQNAVEVAFRACWPIDHGTWQSQLQLKKSLKKGDPLYNHSYVSATQ